MPWALSSRPASSASPTVIRLRPTRFASSSAFGLMRFTRPLVTSRSSGTPLVSSATRAPASRARSNRSVIST